MRVGYFQFAPMLREPERNRRQMERALQETDAGLFVFPELSNSGYNFSRADDLAVSAETIAGGKTIALWKQIAVRRRMIIVGGFAERVGKRFYNSAALVTPRGDVHVYRKAHLFGKERDFFAPGNTPPPVHKVGKIRIGVMICFDWAFPEFARVLAVNGAQIICHPSNIVTRYAQSGMVVRSVENRVFTITANRTGVEMGAAGKLRFPGQSQVVSPGGEVLVSSNETANEWRSVEIDPKIADNKLLGGFTDLMQSRRPELYRKLTQGRSGSVPTSVRSRKTRSPRRRDL